MVRGEKGGFVYEATATKIERASQKARQSYLSNLSESKKQKRKRHTEAASLAAQRQRNQKPKGQNPKPKPKPKGYDCGGQRESEREQKTQSQARWKMGAFLSLFTREYGWAHGNQNNKRGQGRIGEQTKNTHRHKNTGVEIALPHSVDAQSERDNKSLTQNAVNGARL